jgi:selenocysteine lyase/cysteine desulfurase
MNGIKLSIMTLLQTRTLKMLRDRFPIFQHKVYINSCSKGALSTDVRAAYEQYLHDWDEQGSPWGLWVGNLETLRSNFARFINAKSDEIAVKTSVSDAVNAIASSLDFSSRKKIVVDDFAFPTTAQIWHAQQPRGVEIVHVPQLENATIPLEHYTNLIDENTLLVSLTEVCYRHGARQNIKPIVDLAHERGALVMLDSYQALGTFPIDVHAYGVDFLVGGVLKYMLGSAGLAFLYVNEQHISHLYPMATGWFAQSDIFAMDISRHEPSPTARRFESGTPPNPNVYAALAGLALIEEVEVGVIEQHLSEITAAIKHGAREQGYHVVTPDLHGAMIAIKSNDVEQLVGCLAAENIIVSSRDGNLRISPHFYNDLSDIDALMDGLAKYNHLLMQG